MLFLSAVNHIPDSEKTPDHLSEAAQGLDAPDHPPNSTLLKKVLYPKVSPIST